MAFSIGAGVFRSGATPAKLLLTCYAFFAFFPQAWADEGARTRFSLPAVADEGEKEAPFETLFYSRPANFEDLARLREAFRNTDDPANEEIPAGTLLYKVRTKNDVYYCSNRVLRKPTPSDMASLLATAALPLIRTHFPSDNLPQCFRDTDGDGRFDQRSGSTVPIGSIATAIEIVNVQPLTTPVAYEAADVPNPSLEIGLKGTVRNPKSGAFRAEACMHVKKSEFSTEEDTCFRYGGTSFRLKELPVKIKFLDGEITINAVAQAPDGAWRIRYIVSKPITATAIDPVKWLRSFEYELRYFLPERN
jgi:hypothetical protein